MRYLGWKQISFENENGCGKKVTTDTISNILYGCWPFGPVFVLQPSLIWIGSCWSLAKSNGSWHHSELQIFSLNNYWLCSNGSLASPVPPIDATCDSSVGTSENRITRLSWSLSCNGAGKMSNLENGVWLSGTACYSSICWVKLVTWIDDFDILVSFSARFKTVVRDDISCWVYTA
jgi:hypothetical protein